MPKPRPKQSRDGDNSYLQVGRVLDVLDRLRDGPLTTPQLAKALDVSERTTVRFMDAMLHYGWPILYQKANTSALLRWSIDADKLVQRLTRNSGRSRSL